MSEATHLLADGGSIGRVRRCIQFGNMADVKSINDLVGPHEQHLKNLSDDQLIDTLRSFEPLADESDPAWHEEPIKLFDSAGLFVALADQVAERRLLDGIGLLLERACFGDPGEMMRSLRHALEAACNGDWDRLTEICVEKATSDRPGTRLWAVSQLAILRDPAAVGAIRAGLSDSEADVRLESIHAVSMLAQQHPEDAVTLWPALLMLAKTDPVAYVRSEAALVVGSIKNGT